MFTRGCEYIVTISFSQLIYLSAAHSPEVLRCLMGYIVDLTLVMDQLFLNILPLKPPRLLTVDQIDAALEDYKNSEAVKVHRAIREYVNEATFGEILRANNAQQKVIELIKQHRARDA